MRAYFSVLMDEPVIFVNHNSLGGMNYGSKGSTWFAVRGSGTHEASVILYPKHSRDTRVTAYKRDLKKVNLDYSEDQEGEVDDLI